MKPSEFTEESEFECTYLHCKEMPMPVHLVAIQNLHLRKPPKYVSEELILDPTYHGVDIKNPECRFILKAEGRLLYSWKG